MQNKPCQQVRHNKEDKRYKEIIQQLLLEMEELRDSLSQAQKAADGCQRGSALCQRCCGERLTSDGRRPNSLATLLTSMQSNEGDEPDTDIVALLRGQGAADAAIKVL